MEIRIGVQNVNRELIVESDLTTAEAAKLVAAATTGNTLELTDVKGRLIVVPSSALAYVEIGEETRRRVGFEA